MECPDCETEMNVREEECLLGYGAKDLADSVMVKIYTCPKCNHEEEEDEREDRWANEDNDDFERWEE